MKDKPPTIVGVGILVQLSFAVVVAIMLPLLAGIWIERTFSTGPVVLMAMLGVGLLLGAAAVYHILQDAYAQLGGGK